MAVIAGDVGGSKTILAMVEVKQGEVQVLTERRFSSPEFPGLAPMIREFLSGVSCRVDRACCGVPGAVVNRSCRTPNLPWQLHEESLQQETGIPRVTLVNDFAAAALGVIALPPEAFAPIQEGSPRSHGPKAVLGAGTGLGQALLWWDGRRYRVQATESGHCDFAPQGDLQRALLAHLERGLSHVSVERVVSGPGLIRIYRFLVDQGMPPAPAVQQALESGDAPSMIADLATNEQDPTCDAALDCFVRAYGAEAGNLALRTLPSGGLYVAGGIAPKILPRLQDGTFLRAFRSKGRLSDLVATIPVHVVLEERAGLFGASLLATSGDSVL